MAQKWLTVDKDGLKELVASRPAWYAIAELAQNCWDEDSTYVAITLEKLSGRPAARLTVEDDNPEGFKDLSHSYTLFARSEKRADPTKRGRYNLGEKIVLARCIEAEISTTKGTVVFNADGTRSHKRKKRKVGTVFTGVIRMNQQEYDEACAAVWLLNAPIPTTFNGEPLRSRATVVFFEAPLPTLNADAEGNLRNTIRKTEVHIYEVDEGETAHVYELGIPVVETGDSYHVDVQQKVPLNMDRDNVPPSYLRKLRALVLNHTADLLTNDDASEKWIDMALEDDTVEDDAVKQIVKSRFGKKVVVFDPSDPEANNAAAAKGYTVVHGRSLSKRQWENVKRAGAIQPAGQKFPTKHVEYSEHGTPEKVIPEAEWTTDMRAVAAQAKQAAEVALGIGIAVTMVNDPHHQGNSFGAWYGGRCLHFNVRRLGKKWFRHENREEHYCLIIHELAHEMESNHLSADYHDACCRIGAKLVMHEHA